MSDKQSPPKMILRVELNDGRCYYGLSISPEMGRNNNPVIMLNNKDGKQPIDIRIIKGLDVVEIDEDSVMALLRRQRLLGWAELHPLKST